MPNFIDVTLTVSEIQSGLKTWVKRPKICKGGEEIRPTV